MGIALREIIPDGTQWGIPGEYLTDWMNLEFGQDLKSASSISFDYANKGSHFERLKTGMYVTPEVNGNYKYFDSYFYITEQTGSNMPGSMETHLTKFAGPSLRGRLDEVRWMPAFGSSYMDYESFEYRNATPGAVIRAGVENYWSRAKAKGDDVLWLADVGVSKDTAWKYRVDEVVLPTTSVNEIISKYQDLGIGTARFMGFHLHTAHYDWYIKEPPEGTPVPELKVGVNLKDGDYAMTNSNVITALLVRGVEDPFLEGNDGVQSNAVQWVLAPQDAINKWGYHESVLEVPDVSSASTLKAIGENYLRNHLEPKYSTNYVMVDNLLDPRTSLPLDVPNALEDFQCGDSILILDPKVGATMEKVYAITMSYANPTQNPTIGLTLNNAFDSWEVTFDQRLRRLGV